MSVPTPTLEQSATTCPQCGGTNLWIIIEWNGPKKYCLDCNFQCECGQKYRRESKGICPACKEPQSDKSDDDRVAGWMALIRQGYVSSQRISNLGQIGPTGRAALSLLTEILEKRGSEVLAAAAKDAIREHALNASSRSQAETCSKPAPPVKNEPVADKIHFQCPKCVKSVSVRKEYAGKRGKCPGCGTVVTIPAAPARQEPKQTLGTAPRPAPARGAELRDLEIAPAVLDLVPESVARANGVLPIKWIGDQLLLAVPDLSRSDLIDKLRFILNLEIKPVLAGAEEIEAEIERRYASRPKPGIENTAAVSPKVPDAANPVVPPAPPAVTVGLISVDEIQRIDQQMGEIYLHCPRCGEGERVNDMGKLMLKQGNNVFANYRCKGCGTVFDGARRMRRGDCPPS